MNRDFTITLLIVVAAILAFIIFIPKNRVREAFLAFLFAQLLSWSVGLLTPLFGFREFPVRLFPRATDGGFILIYVLYPVLFTIFHICLPKEKGNLYKLIYSIIFISAVTIIDVLLATYTNLLVYKSWSWFKTTILFSVSFFISRRYVVWFFNKLSYSNCKE